MSALGHKIIVHIETKTRVLPLSFQNPDAFFHTESAVPSIECAGEKKRIALPDNLDVNQSFHVSSIKLSANWMADLKVGSEMRCKCVMESRRARVIPSLTICKSLRFVEVLAHPIF
jgi:hypothetical protein